MTAKPAPDNLRKAALSTDFRFMGARAPERSGVALALGGGFARGFAHLGVLEVLEQEKIHIAAIVGTSIGSLLGAAYSDGVPIGTLCELGRRVRVRDFLRYRKSPSSLPPDNPIAEFVRQWLRSKLIEELPIANAMVATDLAICKPHVFTRGSLEIAISSSCAFPGLFDPIEHDGRLLADGCISSPVPTAIAAQMGAACILGVSAGPSAAHVVHDERVVRVGYREQALGAGTECTTPSWVRQSDIFLEPEVSHIGWTDFSRVVEAYESGTRAMRLALPHVRDLLDRRDELKFKQIASVGLEDYARS